MKPRAMAGLAFILGAIGLLIYGIISGESLVPVAMALLVAGLALSAKARERGGK